MSTEATSPLGSISSQELLAELARRGELGQALGVVEALCDQLDRTGAMDGEHTAYLVYRMRREAMLVSGLPDAAERAQSWQDRIDAMEREAVDAAAPRTA